MSEISGIPVVEDSDVEAFRDAFKDAFGVVFRGDHVTRAPMSWKEATLREFDEGVARSLLRCGAWDRATAPSKLDALLVASAAFRAQPVKSPPVKPAGYQLMSQPGDDTRVYHTYRADSHEVGVHSGGISFGVYLDPATAVRLAQAILAAEDWAAHDIARKHAESSA